MKPIAPIPTVYNTEDGAWEDNEDEHTFWPRVMWVDAGVVTGIAVIWFHPMRLLDIAAPTARSILAWHVNFVTGDENQQAYEILRMVRGLGGPEGLAVGAEWFRVRSVNGTDDFLSSPRIVSKLEYGLWRGTRDWDGELRRRTLLRQEPSEIDKSERGDERLRLLRLYVPGADHRRDALKHGLLHLGKLRNLGMGARTAIERLYGWNGDWEDVQ